MRKVNKICCAGGTKGGKGRERPESCRRRAFRGIDGDGMLAVQGGKFGRGNESRRGKE